MRTSEILSKAVKTEYLIAKSQTGREAQKKASGLAQKKRDAEANAIVLVAIGCIALVTFLLNYFFNG